MESIKEFFHSQGITIVTIQPEFRSLTIANNQKHRLEFECLMGCLESCNSKKCCKTLNLQSIQEEEEEVKNSTIEKIEILQTDQQIEDKKEQSKSTTSVSTIIKNDKENLHEETVDISVQTLMILMK